MLGCLLACRYEPVESQPSADGAPPPPDNGAPADLVFEQDGTNYALTAGNLYEVRGDGSRKLVERLYDPDFRAKNYIRDGGRIFQIDPSSGERYAVTRQYRDGFEGADDVEALMDVNRWHRYNTDPKQAGQPDNFYDQGNTVEIAHDIVKSGESSIRFHALPDARSASKAAIARNVMYFEKGDDFWFSGWFYVEDTPSIVDAGAFTLVDLESSFLRYDGMRVIFRRNDSLAYELKMPKVQFEQERGREVPFPTDQWVNVKTHIHLDERDGHVEIWQDGQQVLDRRGQTLPLADTIYNSLELGITVIASGSRYDKVLYVDDIRVSDAPL